MRNSLNSFLGIDRGEVLSKLLRITAESFTHQLLQESVERAIDSLSEASDDSFAWGILQEVLGDTPPHKDLSEQFAIVFNHTDFVRLCQKEMALGIYAMKTASQQIVHLKNEGVRLYLKDQAVKIAQLFAEKCKGMSLHSLTDDNQKVLDWISNSLIEFARNIALAVQAPQDVIEEFVDIFTQVVEGWDFMSKICKPLIQIFIEDLPISQSQKFWRLLVRLRADKS